MLFSCGTVFIKSLFQNLFEFSSKNHLPSFSCLLCKQGVVGWCDGPGKLPVPGRPTIWITVGHGPTVLAVGAGGGCLDIFSLVYHFSFLTPSLWETDGAI